MSSIFRTLDLHSGRLLVIVFTMDNVLPQLALSWQGQVIGYYLYNGQCSELAALAGNFKLATIWTVDCV